MASSAISLGGCWLSCLPLSRNHCNGCDVSLKAEWQSFYDPYFKLLWSNDKQCCSANHVSPKLTKSLLCLVYELMIEDITVGVQRKLKWRVLPQVNLCPLFWLYDPLRIWMNTREKRCETQEGSSLSQESDSHNACDSTVSVEWNRTSNHFSLLVIRADCNGGNRW